MKLEKFKSLKSKRDKLGHLINTNLAEHQRNIVIAFLLLIEIHFIEFWYNTSIRRFFFNDHQNDIKDVIFNL